MENCGIDVSWNIAREYGCHEGLDDIRRIGGHREAKPVAKLSPKPTPSSQVDSTQKDFSCRVGSAASSRLSNVFGREVLGHGGDVDGGEQESEGSAGDVNGDLYHLLSRRRLAGAQPGQVDCQILASIVALPDSEGMRGEKANRPITPRAVL